MSGFVRLSGEGRVIDAGAFEVSVVADATDTGGVCSVVETYGDAGLGPPLHIHHDVAEAFYIVEGSYVMVLGDERVMCPAGSFVFIPAGMPHTFVGGPDAGRKLNFYFPAGMVGYFDDLSAAVAGGEVDDAALAELAAKHAMEVLGPVPEKYL